MSDFFENSEVKEEKIGYSDAESITIKLSTGGKLSAPPSLKVTDYTMEDVLKLSGTTNDDIFKNLIEIVQAILQDNFDARNFHENEFEEVLLSVYGNFWNRLITEYPYPWTEKEINDLVEQEIITSERAEKIISGKEIPRVDIVIPNIELNEIPESFAEPIVIQHNNLKIGLRLPRIGDYLLTEDYLIKKYAIKNKQFADIKLAVRQEKTEKVDPERMMKYMKFEKEYAIDFLRVKQSLLILFVEKEGVRTLLTTIEEKVAIYKKINKKFWDIFTRELEKIKFGINHDVKMISPFTKESVTRRCLFQVMDLIPTNDVYDDTGYTLSFGDVSENLRE